MTHHDLELLRRRWDEGKRSGRAGPLDVWQLIAEERARFEGRAERREQADADQAHREAAANPRGST